MKKRYFSFDIFDTCLARLCGEPTNLYDVLSKKVMALCGRENEEHLRQRFVTLRVGAGKREASLKAIYNDMAQSFPLPKTTEEMMNLEIETEREMLVPVAETLRLVEAMRGCGCIMFISDMYLPSAFLRERLENWGFFKEGDKIFISNEWDARKHDGSLYQKIHKLEGIPYGRWDHYGDNRDSDYSVPKKLGIHAHLIEFPFLPYEKRWTHIPSYQYPWPSLLAGISRALRLQSDAPEEQKKFVCDISAPLMTAFIINVMEDAWSKRIKRLFFCARDMHSYFLIAKQLSQRFPSIEIHYAFISGETLYENTEHTLDYFRQIGLASKDALTAIVDTNTKGGSLPAINRMMEKHGWNPVHGYFITGTDEASTSFEESTLPCYSVFSPYVKDTGRQEAASIIGMRILYELVFCLNYHKKTVSYEFHGNTIRPVLAQDTEDILSFKTADIRKMKQSNDKLLVDYASAVNKTMLPEYGKEILNLLALPTLTDFISYPDKEYLSYLNDFQLSGSPFVDKLYGRKHPVWRRGSLVYSVPSLVARRWAQIARNEKKRKRISKIIQRWR